MPSANAFVVPGGDCSGERGETRDQCSFRVHAPIKASLNLGTLPMTLLIKKGCDARRNNISALSSLHPLRLSQGRYMVQAVIVRPL